VSESKSSMLEKGLNSSMSLGTYEKQVSVEKLEHQRIRIQAMRNDLKNQIEQKEIKDNLVLKTKQEL
jgi:hypothetical protein